MSWRFEGLMIIIFMRLFAAASIATLATAQQDPAFLDSNHWPVATHLPAYPYYARSSDFYVDPQGHYGPVRHGVAYRHMEAPTEFPELHEQTEHFIH